MNKLGLHASYPEYCIRELTKMTYECLEVLEFRCEDEELYIGDAEDNVRDVMYDLICDHGSIELTGDEKFEFTTDDIWHKEGFAELLTEKIGKIFTIVDYNAVESKIRDYIESEIEEVEGLRINREDRMTSRDFENLDNIVSLHGHLSGGF